MTNHEPRPSSIVSPTVVRLAALWVLTGATFKLFLGSPNDLPPVVRDFVLGPELTFKLAIAIELSFALTALLRPRLGFVPLAMLFMVFLGILVQLVASGASSCGCLGSRVTMPPAVMMGIDATCLVAMLAARPWSAIPARRAPFALLAAVWIASWAAPWVVISTPAPTEAARDASSGEWRPPEKLPRFAQLRPLEWVGKPIDETELAVWMDVGAYPQDATWVLYSATCEHCAAHLRQLANDFASDPRLYVLIRIDDETDESQFQVDMKPPGEEAQLVTGVPYVITPPWDLTLEDGVVTDAVHPDV